eukprot:GSChrysophyteH1.ASY1.ANO1.1995.1 assembled CDS
MTESATEIKLFGKWSLEDVEISDISLTDFIAVKDKHATFVAHTAGRYQRKKFRKASCPIVERLACSIMRRGRNNGKKLMAVRIVKHTLELIAILTDSNPVQVLVDAIINSGPREDSCRVGSAGVVRRQAVDVSPFRRIINAARGSSNSYAIKKKDEIERVAKANR